MSDTTDALQSLHTALVDSREGYEKALDLAEGKGLSPLFREMIALRTQHAVEIDQHLVAHAAAAGDGTSFMATVHRTVIGIRALFTELDESILPGLIDGEKRVVGDYDDAIATVSSGSPEHATLIAQRAVLLEAIGRMEAKASKADVTSS